tara:strand:- start:162 stop:377 length:216 start_codon:yes stop_codon:yes gene_type:complete
MSKNKNITNKEIQRRFNFLASHMQTVTQHLQSLSDLIMHYIQFNKDEDKLTKYLNKLNKDIEKDAEKKEGK